MALTIDWGTKVINVPKADTSLVSAGPPEIRSLDIDAFRLELKDLEDSEVGMAFEDTHRHIAPVTVGGVTLARVVEIINGYTVTFENGSYAVNLNGANSNIGDVLNLNNVQVRSANSAGLTYSKSIEDLSFIDGRVYINTSSGQSGTQYPIGTSSFPVDNLTDAQTIISNRSLPKRLFLTGDITVGASVNLDDYDIEGAGSNLAGITFTSGASTNQTIIKSADIQGTVSGPIFITDTSSLGTLSGFEGIMNSGGLAGTTTLASTDADNRIELVKCYSLVAGANRPIIDANGLANLELNIRGYHGGLEIRNVNVASMNISIDADSAKIVLHSSCTAGTIVIRGAGILQDDSAGSTIDSSSFVQASHMDEIWALHGLDIDNAMTVTPTSRSFGTVSQTISGDGTTTTTVTRDP